MKQKFIDYYMRIAKLVGQDHNPCHSRQIGAVIVCPTSNRILGTGYNGPPPGTPHPETEEYLREYFWPQLTYDERDSLRASLGGLLEEQINCKHDFSPLTDRCLKCNISQAVWTSKNHVVTRELFVNKYAGQKICPRRIIGAKSGQRSELCSCGHAERHAITNAACDLHNKIMFCWCGVPCLQCMDAIIQAGITQIYCLKEYTDYHPKSRWLAQKAYVEIFELEEKGILP